MTPQGYPLYVLGSDATLYAVVGWVNDYPTVVPLTKVNVARTTSLLTGATHSWHTDFDSAWAAKSDVERRREASLS